MINNLIRELSRNNNIVLSMLGKIEIDTLKISEQCPKQCSHCSQSPGAVVKCLSFNNFKKYIDDLIVLQEMTNMDLLANYVLPSTDSDPFLNQDISKIADYFWKQTGRRFYFLTSGWYMTAENQNNAEWFVKHPNSIEKMELTLSNFPTRPDSIFAHAEIFINVVKTFSRLPKEKFIISPQYNAEVDNNHIHSLKQTRNLFEYVIKTAGYKVDDFAGRVFYRPIIGLGKAKSILHVKNRKTYRIEAEVPAPIISIREKERPFSAIINLQGDITILKSKRGELNRDLKHYKLISQFF